VTRNGEGATHVRSISFEGEQGTLVMGAIGFLGSASPSTQASRAAAFVQRLRELGWIENRTVACSGKALVSQCAPEAPIGVTFRQKALRYQRTAQSVLNRAASRSVHAFHSRRPWRTPPSRVAAWPMRWRAVFGLPEGEGPRHGLPTDAAAVLHDARATTAIRASYSGVNRSSTCNVEAPAFLRGTRYA
jgi:hypothetical protein